MYAIYLQATFLNDIALPLTHLRTHIRTHTYVGVGTARVIGIELEQDMTSIV